VQKAGEKRLRPFLLKESGPSLLVFITVPSLLYSHERDSMARLTFPASLLLFLCWLRPAAAQPEIAVLVVVDQLAEHILSTHRSFLRGGIARLFHKGMYFSHAYYPHSQPETATGHAMISTGAYAKRHGLVANEWIDNASGKRINACDDLTGTNCTVFAPTDKTGKSARALEAETLASACRKAKRPYKTIAISLKSRAAIPLAGPHGLAIWFDTKGGVFTSSTAFCPHLPYWVAAMNKHLEKTLHVQKSTEWSPLYPEDSLNYCYVNNAIYTHTGTPASLITTPQPFTKPDGSRYFHPFEQTPQASQEVLRLALLAASEHRKKNKLTPLLLCVSLSNFDYAGHYFGPSSKECIDTLYAIDRQLSHFMTEIEGLFGTQNCLWALTADHGVSPIPELSHAEGNMQAKRIDANVLAADLNRILYNLYNVKNLFKSVLPPHFYVDQDKWTLLNPEIQKKVIESTKDYLKRIDGIVDAWHKTDLTSPTFHSLYPKQSVAHWFAAQYRPDRSGDFIAQVAPYVQLSPYPKGTCHDSPYDLDTRVPVLFMGSGVARGICDYTVSMRHFAPTMAALLGAPQPRHAPKKHWGRVLRTGTSLQSASSTKA